MRRLRYTGAVIRPWPAIDPGGRRTGAGARQCAAWLLAVAAATCSGAVAAGDAPAALPPGWHEDQVFDRHSPLAAKWEFARRVFTPTTFDRLRRFERAAGVVAAEHALDLREERFDVFVPGRRPPGGYGLVVFVSPMQDFVLPADWKRELDKRGIAFVAARRSGNRENMYERRMPLALHAYGNVAARLPLDPERVVVAGFSGGARIAQRLALAYPDVFRGAILFASSDPFGVPGVRPGEAPLWPPLREFMETFQARTRVVFITGSQDLPNRARDARTRESLRDYCVRHVTEIAISRLGHWLPDRRGLSRALDAVGPGSGVAADGPDAGCDGRLQRRVEAALDDVAALLDAGRARAAGEALGRVEDRFGGLAAPRSVELSHRIARALHAGGGQRD